MAPGKKSNKNEDWDLGLGESIGGSVDANEGMEGTQVDEGSGKETWEGGLLAALKKNRGKKAQKGKEVKSLESMENDLIKGGNQGKQEVELPDEYEEDVFGALIKKEKPVKAKQPPSKVGHTAEETQADIKLKSKKEKEKEKKEREKQRKKEQAAKKKTTVVTSQSVPVVNEVLTKQDEKSESKESETGGGTGIGTGGSKVKKPNATILAIQKQLEAKKKREEELAKLQAEERAREEELIRKEEEEMKKKEEARAARKLKEKQKMEQLKKMGKFMTKAQKEAAERNRIRTQQLLESGAAIIVGGRGEKEGEGEKKKKPTYDNKKAKVLKRRLKEEEQAAAAAAAETEAMNKKLEEMNIETNLRGDSTREKHGLMVEALSDSSEELDERSDKLGEEFIKESWDMSSEEESEKIKGRHAGASRRAREGISRDADGRAEFGIGKNDGEKEDSTDEAGDDVVESGGGSSGGRKKRSKGEGLERKQKLEEKEVGSDSGNGDVISEGESLKDKNLRSPICCILGHVDTGKTKLLDRLRETNVQEGEAGGITQQIGATYFPIDAIKKKMKAIMNDGQCDLEFKIPGLLIIDTPGHESFSNLRWRGSSLCNIAILVVDIMHGLEKQTVECLKMLREMKTPFIVALNKIDRLFNWKSTQNNGFLKSLTKQNLNCQNEFKDRLSRIKLEFSEQGFNSEVYYENKSFSRNVSLVPISSITGEGIPDLLKLLIKLTQERMLSELIYLTKVEATILEVKIIEGLGTTIDVILSNGILYEGDRIALCGVNGAIFTNIRALLTPAEMKELRIKSNYVHNKSVKAAMGIKIAADKLDDAIAGSRIMVVGPDDDEEEIEEDIMSDLESLLSRISKSGKGVSVQASTLGSLEALLEFLKVSKIPVANISIGPVYKRDVIQCGIMLERAPEYAVMLCFDVRIDREAVDYAKQIGVKIFSADIIYHLFDEFTEHLRKIELEKKEQSKMIVVFPCVLKHVAIFNKRDPIVIGVDVVEGSLRLNTTLCIVKADAQGRREYIDLGRVTSIERDHKNLTICKKGQPSVAIKIEGPNQPIYGRHIEEKDTIYSHISRLSIDTLKQFYKSDMTTEDWLLVKKLKPLFEIP